MASMEQTVYINGELRGFHDRSRLVITPNCSYERVTRYTAVIHRGIVHSRVVDFRKYMNIFHARAMRVVVSIEHRLSRRSED